MDKLIKDIIELAEELLSSGKYREASDALGEIDPDSISPDEKALYSLFLADAEFHLNNYKVIDQLYDAMDYFRRVHDFPHLARAKFLEGWYLMATGRRFEAREKLIEAGAIYERENMPIARARVLNRLALLSYTKGEMSAAEEYLKKCIAIYGDMQDHHRRLIVSSNLALLYGEQGYINKGLEICRQVGAEINDWSEQLYVNECIQDALFVGKKGDISQALAILDKAESYSQYHPHGRAMIFNFRGKIYWLHGQLEKARDCYRKVIEMTRSSEGQVIVLANARMNLAEVCLDLGEFEEAASLNKKALDVYEDINERIKRAGCYRNLGRLEAHQGNRKAGRQWFAKAFDICLELNARWDLAMTRYLGALSGLYEGGEKQALLYLAREYFAEEQIEYMVTRITEKLEAAAPAPSLKFDNRQVKGLEIVTVNREMKRLLSVAERVAPSNISVLLTGATGTGKDLFARFIHHHSGRSGRFVSVNAAAIPDSMVESELFGHRKGAFTNAERDKTGLIEVAQGGTLYLNEIADATPELQAKLLDVLENHRIRRLGETSERPVDFRLIAATNHDLDQLIDKGKFRIDLYHRLSEVPIDLPLLRERQDDIPALMVHFLSLAGLTIDEKSREFKRLVKILSRREWPGNIRQFEVEIKRLSLLSGGDFYRMIQLLAAKKTTEREQLLELLEDNNWNRRAVGRKLGISDTTVRRKIKKYGLDK